jgi:outer membrane protein assembly factor BamE (lipoprotein component of BamABCDE complex)
MRHLLWIGFIFLSACVSLSLERSLEKLKVGMDKDEVLRAVGNPRRTFRERGQDNWIYVFYRGESEMNRIVVFEDGKVAKINRPFKKAVWEKDIEASKKDPDAGFQSIDGAKE